MTTQNTPANTAGVRELKEVTERMHEIMLPNDAYQYMRGALSMAIAMNEKNKQRELKKSIHERR